MPPDYFRLFVYIRKTAPYFMKTGLSFLLTCFSALLFAQQAIIEPDNPSPRVGDNVILNLLLLESITPNGASADPDKKIASGSLRFSQTLTDTGAVNIGPFSFTVNNNTYEASVITLQIRPPLPENEVKGVWASIVKFREYIYVIIEQRIPNSVKRDPANPNTLVLATDEPEFAELITERMAEFGLEFISSSVNMDTEMINRRGSAVNVAYRLASYKFRSAHPVSNEVRIDKSFFTSFPRGISFKEPVLR